MSLTALAAAAPAVAHAAAIGGVRFAVNGHAGPRLPLALLAGANADVPPTPMTTRYADGHQTVDSHKGTSARRLVVLAGLDPAHVTELTIQQPLGRAAVLLSGADIVNGFGAAALPATFDAGYNTTEVHFFRPQRDAGDVNAPDAVDPPIGTDLLVALRTDGGVLSVSAGADPTRTDAGAPVSFSVSVEGAPSDVTFAWDFGDGADATTTSDTIAHVYATDASYDATVTAVTRGGDSGAAIAHVQVGSPAGAAGGTLGGGGTALQTGGGSGGRSATSTGRAHGSAGRITSHGVAHGRDDARVDDRPATARRSTTPASAAPAPATASPAATGGGTSRRRPPHPGARGRRHVAHAREAPARDHVGRGPMAGAAPEVSGVLLASSGRAAAALARLGSHAAGSPRDPLARASATSARSLGWWLLGGLALAALLGLGAAREAGLRLPGRRREPA